MSSNTDAFTFIERTADLGSDGEKEPPQLFPKYDDLLSGKLAGPILQLHEELRAKYPDLVVTYVDPISLNLLTYAYAGHATATLDIETDSVFRMRVWQQPSRRGAIGHLAEARGFAKYQYRWKNEVFILYTIVIGLSSGQFLLKERGPGESQLSHSAVTDTLLAQVGLWNHKVPKGIYVYDLYWRLDEGLYEQVQKASWDKVILDPGMKKELKNVSNRFFDSKGVYDDLGVPWKRGLIFYGPPGNGKTVSIKALMHTLADRKDPVPTLYVKTAPRTFDTRNIFALARLMSPCLLILEDIDTIVTAATRSYFYNEVDGLENNDGILMVASTNYIEKLDPGLAKRPSRFDRKYLFPAPSKAERVQYVQFWRQKLKAKSEVEFPELLVEPIARITHDFSFAYIQEAFVSSLLEIAHRRDDQDEDEEPISETGGGDEDLEKYQLWRVINEQVKILRDEMNESVSGCEELPTPVATHPATQVAHCYTNHCGCPSTSSEGIDVPCFPNIQYPQLSAVDEKPNKMFDDDGEALYSTIDSSSQAQALYELVGDLSQCTSQTVAQVSPNVYEMPANLRKRESFDFILLVPTPPADAYHPSKDLTPGRKTVIRDSLGPREGRTYTTTYVNAVEEGIVFMPKDKKAFSELAETNEEFKILVHAFEKRADLAELVKEL